MFRVERLLNAKIIAFNEKDSVNHINYCHNQGGINAVTEDFQSYLSSFEDDDKMPLQNHCFVQKQQGKFHNATSSTKCVISLFFVKDCQQVSICTLL